MFYIIAAVFILMGLGFVGLLIKDYVQGDSLNTTKNDEEEAAFCEIDMDHVLKFPNETKNKDVNELKRKLQDFKNRNKFYKM